MVSVAHTKINVRQTKQKMPEGSDRKGLNNIRYTVTFPTVYKVSCIISTSMKTKNEFSVPEGVEWNSSKRNLHSL